MLPPYILKLVASTAIPKLINQGIKYFFDTIPTDNKGFFEEKKYIKLKKKRKKVDSTKINRYHYDFVILAYKDWLDYNFKNINDKKNQDELVNILNTRMGLKKSRAVYCRIWTGRTKRENLPEGELDFNNLI